MLQNDETQTKICLIFGGDSGVGKAAALMLARTGSTVVIACRDMEGGGTARREIIAKTGNNSVSLIECDPSSQKSIRDCAGQFKKKYARLDALINNVANFDLSLSRPVLTEDGRELIFAMNYLGPFLLTNLLLDSLKNGGVSRVVNIVSRGLSLYPLLTIEFDNLNSERRYSPAHAYHHAKLALVMFTYELAARLRETSVTVNCVWVPNEKLGDDLQIRISPLKKWLYLIQARSDFSQMDMAELYLWLATAKDAGSLNGRCIDEKRRVVRTPKSSYDGDIRRRLWDVSLKLTGLEA
ncbi:MAG: SDR family NAD(P)-dependent oxidoreductase [Spirochaetales bacterium]|nr:SDR family NAD(P)-dependent oxidoreductase [Spirochaetales bacterium]